MGRPSARRKEDIGSGRGFGWEEAGRYDRAAPSDSTSRTVKLTGLDAMKASAESPTSYRLEEWPVTISRDGYVPV